MSFSILMMLRPGICLVTVMFCTACAAGHHKNENPNEDISSSENPPATQEARVIARPVLKFIRNHRNSETHLDGPRCPFYPSCSAWGERAIAEHPVSGFLLLLDRLFYREWIPGNYYHVVNKRKSRSERYYDPVTDSLPLFKKKGASLITEDHYGR